MSQLVEAFVLGNGAILTNVCMLPLYPSMVAYLAADAAPGGGSALGPGVKRRTHGAVGAWLGLLVLAGVCTMMTAVGLTLFLLRQSFGTILPWLLPLLAGPAQQHFTHWLVGRHGLLTRAAGLLLVGIGLFGTWAEIVPMLLVS